MKKPRRKYTLEFKHETARLVLDEGYSINVACPSLDVGARH